MNPLAALRKVSHNRILLGARLGNQSVCVPASPRHHGGGVALAILFNWGALAVALSMTQWRWAWPTSIAAWSLSICAAILLDSGYVELTEATLRAMAAEGNRGEPTYAYWRPVWCFIAYALWAPLWCIGLFIAVGLYRLVS